MRIIIDYMPAYHTPFFADLFSYGNPFSELLLVDGFFLVPQATFTRIMNPLKERLQKQQKSLIHEIKQWEALFAKPEHIHFEDHSSFQLFLKAWFLQPLYELAAKQVLFDSLKGDFAENYKIYKLLTMQKTLSPKEEEQLSLYKIALLIEKNKTIKKAFTSAPLKIKEKLETFYINIYNKILAHERHFQWLYQPPLVEETYDDLAIIRMLKRIIKEENIRRGVQDLQERRKKLQQGIGQLKRRKLLTKKLLYLSSLLDLLGNIHHLRRYFFYRWFATHKKTLSKLLEEKKIPLTDLLAYPYTQLLTKQKPKPYPSHYFLLKKKQWKEIKLKKQILQQMYHEMTVPFFITNFSERKEGTITLEQKNVKQKIVVVSSLEKPSESLLEGTLTALIIDEGILPTLPLFSLLKQYPLVLETQWLSHVVKEGMNISIVPSRKKLLLQ